MIHIYKIPDHSCPHSGTRQARSAPTAERAIPISIFLYFIYIYMMTQLGLLLYARDQLAGPSTEVAQIVLRLENSMTEQC